MNQNLPKWNLANRRLRAYARVEIPGECLIHNENNLYIAPLGNLSAGGCYVSRLHHIEEGTEVRVIVKSNRLNAPIQAKGVVVRVEKENKVGLAIEFTSIDQEARDSIQTLVYENKLQNALKII